MARLRVPLHRTFIADARRHRDWLVEQRRLAWADNLMRAIDEVSARLAEFPASGSVILRSDDMIDEGLCRTIARMRETVPAA